MIDFALLDKTMATIEHIYAAQQADSYARRRWNQQVWREIHPAAGGHRCSTSMCLAGWVVESEAEWLYSDAYMFKHNRNLLRDSQARSSGEPYRYEWVDTYISEDLVRVGEDYDGEAYAIGYGPHAGTRVAEAQHYARWKLGLSLEQSDELFNGDNTLYTLQAIIEEYKGEAVV